MRARLDHGVGRLLQLARSKLPSLQLDLHGEAAGVADALDRPAATSTKAMPSSSFCSALLQAEIERAQLLALLPRSAPVVEDDVGDAGIGERGVVVERRDAGDGDDLLARPASPWRCASTSVQRLLGALERGAVGKLHARQQVALVLDRQEPVGTRARP